MVIITDLRILKPIIKKYGLDIDKTHKYILKDVSLKVLREMAKEGLNIEYISGCFYPYLNKMEGV
jgi:hypothetical protein